MTRTNNLRRQPTDHATAVQQIREITNETVPASVLDLLNRIIADERRTLNAKTLLTASGGALARVVLSAGAILLLTCSLAIWMTRAAGHDIPNSGVVVAGGAAALLTTRYFRTRNTSRRRNRPSPTKN